MPVHEFGRPPPDPADEALHLGMLPHRFRLGQGGGKFFFRKKGMEFAVADKVQRLGLPTALGFGLPVVPVHAGSGHHLPAAHRAGAQKLTGFAPAFL